VLRAPLAENLTWVGARRSPTLAAVVARLRRRRSGRRAVARRAASTGAPSCLASFEVAAIVGRCLPGDPMKGSAERARAMESHIECNLADRVRGVASKALARSIRRRVQ
jgi:hypothetical protein